MKKRALLTSILTLVFIFTMILTTYGFAAPTWEKKSMSMAAASKSKQIEIEADVKITGTGFGKTGNITSLGIVPAKAAVNSTDFNKNMVIIYSSTPTQADSKIKAGKFSVTTPLAAAFEGSPMKPGKIKVVVWYIPTGSKAEKCAISKDAFTIVSGK